MFPLVQRFAAIAAIFIFGALSNGSAQTASAKSKPLIRRLIVATVWPGQYSEIILASPPVWCMAVSNIDFRFLAPRLVFETTDAVYEFVIVGLTLTPKDIVDERRDGYLDAKGFPWFWPQQLPPQGGAARYVPLTFQSSPLLPNNELATLDALHQYYQANRAQLEGQAQQHPLALQSYAEYQAALKAAHTKPAVSFKRIEYSSPSPNPHK